MELDVYNEQGEVTGKVSFDEGILGDKVRRRLLHQVLVMYDANRRRGTHSTKTKGERRGSDKKPWRQKGTGRARAGDRRSPLWRKGGVTFGPKPRSYRFKVPRTARRQALKSALLAKFRDGEVKVVEGLSFEEPKTRRVVNLLHALEITGSCLISTLASDPILYKSSRNIPKVEVLEARNLNARAVLLPKQVVMTREVVENLKDLVER